MYRFVLSFHQKMALDELYSNNLNFKWLFLRDAARESTQRPRCILMYFFHFFLFHLFFFIELSITNHKIASKEKKKLKSTQPHENRNINRKVKVKLEVETRISDSRV